ncbi:alpha/beta fold hydrolase [Microbacterium karelineae]|uniref:alpha/beta fold hydrolase n=1 Tax=Microbacterium karelineae TaxID=2654283 RepID=UPI0012EA8C67|nr:alpha/beta fold hydrolase [Microbacterium karelineae]
MNAIAYTASRPEGSPTIVLASSLGTDRTMWRDQLELFPSDWNVVAFDLPGHGESALSPSTPTIDDFADGVISVVDELGVDTFAFCGLSIGGAIGQSLAARYPARVDSLILASTGLTILTPTGLRDRSARVLREGTGWIADLSGTRWFAEAFQQSHEETVAAHLDHLRRMDPRAYSDACLALAGFDGSDYAAAITASTLVIAGEVDHATPPEKSEELAASISGAQLRLIPGAAHICNVEKPVEFTELVRDHIVRSR